MLDDAKQAWALANSLAPHSLLGLAGESARTPGGLRLPG